RGWRLQVAEIAGSRSSTLMSPRAGCAPPFAGLEPRCIAIPYLRNASLNCLSLCLAGGLVVGRFTDALPGRYCLGVSSCQSIVWERSPQMGGTMFPITSIRIVGLIAVLCAVVVAPQALAASSTHSRIPPDDLSGFDLKAGFNPEASRIAQPDAAMGYDLSGF